MNVRDLIPFKARRGDWHALSATDPPEDWIMTLGWLAITGTVLAAVLLAASASI